MSCESYQEEFTVKSYECDICRQMTAAAVLRRAQQAATDQCDSLGLTEQVYDRTNTAFLLSKQAVEFYEPIYAGSRVRIETRPCAPQRAVYYRFAVICDVQTGRELCAVDSRWVLVNTAARRILRTPPEGFPAIFTRQPQRTLDLSIKKGEAESAVQLKALYSRCDQNGHINNAAYADIVCDFVPYEKMLLQMPKRLIIAYHREIPMGAAFELKQVQTGENEWYFCGSTRQERNFEASLLLMPRPGKSTDPGEHTKD